MFQAPSWTISYAGRNNHMQLAVWYDFMGKGAVWGGGGDFLYHAVTVTTMYIVPSTGVCDKCCLYLVWLVGFTFLLSFFNKNRKIT